MLRLLKMSLIGRGVEVLVLVRRMGLKSVLSVHNCVSREEMVFLSSTILDAMSAAEDSDRPQMIRLDLHLFRSANY